MGKVLCAAANMHDANATE